MYARIVTDEGIVFEGRVVAIRVEPVVTEFCLISETDGEIAACVCSYAIDSIEIKSS